MNLVYLHYKEPLKPVTNGYYGYQGTLAQTEDGSKVQCHICGELCYNLGVHVFNAHGIKAAQYREMFELNKRTPLCSDKASQDYKNRAVAVWEAKTESEKEQQRKIMRAAAKVAPKPGNYVQLERRNQLGMCPDQLLEKIRVLADNLGSSPTVTQFKAEYGDRFIFTIQRTFGSWNAAKAQLGLSPCKTGQRVPHNKGVCKFTIEELLAYLRNHYERTQTIPTFSDWKRYYFPDYHIYLRQFGSIKEARRQAGLPVDKL
jgi:hypothetical protein